MEIVLGLLAVLVVSGLVAAFVAARPKRRNAELEPPPVAAPLPPPEAKAPAKPPKAKRPSIPTEEELARQAAEVGAEAEAVLAGAREAPVELVEPEAAPAKPRFRDRLGKARGLLAGYLGSVRARTKIDDDTWDELDEALIRADVGITATTALLDQLRAQAKAENITSPELLVDALKDNPKKRHPNADR